MTKKQFLLLTLAMAISVGRAFCAGGHGGEDLDSLSDGFWDAPVGSPNPMAASYMADRATDAPTVAADDRRGASPAPAVREIPVVLGTSPEAVAAATSLGAILLPADSVSPGIACVVALGEEDVLGNPSNGYTIVVTPPAPGEAAIELVIVFSDDDVHVQRVTNANFRYVPRADVVRAGAHASGLNPLSVDEEEWP